MSHPLAVKLGIGRESFRTERSGKTLFCLRADGLEHCLPVFGRERLVVGQLARGLLGLPADDEPEKERLRLGADRLLGEFPTLEMVAVTRGAQGSLLVRREAWSEHPGFPVKVVDRIGAGDAFTAALTHYMLRGADLATLNEAGNRWGSWVASQSGAMPALPEEVRAAIAAAIEP